MVGKRGKLYDSVFLDLNDSDYLQSNIYEALNEARSRLILVETMDELNAWSTEWLGDIVER